MTGGAPRQPATVRAKAVAPPSCPQSTGVTNPPAPSPPRRPGALPPQPPPGPGEVLGGGAAEDDPPPRRGPAPGLERDPPQPTAAAADEDGVRVGQAGKGLGSLAADGADQARPEAADVGLQP